MVFRFTCLLVVFGFTMLGGIKAMFLPPDGNGGSLTLECKDRSPSCPVDAKNGLCDAFGESYKMHVCPLSCEVCGCKDLQPKSVCQPYKDRNLCELEQYNTKHWCRQTCGHCGKF